MVSEYNLYKINLNEEHELKLFSLAFKQFSIRRESPSRSAENLFSVLIFYGLLRRDGPLINICVHFGSFFH